MHLAGRGSEQPLLIPSPPVQPVLVPSPTCAASTGSLTCLCCQYWFPHLPVQPALVLSPICADGTGSLTCLCSRYWFPHLSVHPVLVPSPACAAGTGSLLPVLPVLVPSPVCAAGTGSLPCLCCQYWFSHLPVQPAGSGAQEPVLTQVLREKSENRVHARDPVRG